VPKCAIVELFFTRPQGTNFCGSLRPLSKESQSAMDYGRCPMAACERGARFIPALTVATIKPMAITSSVLGPTSLSGEEAKAFARIIIDGRSSKAAAESAANGRRLVATFAKMGRVAIELRPDRR